MYVRLHLYEVFRVVKITDTESRMVVTRGWREKKMESYCLMGTKFQFYTMKRVMEMDGGDGYMTL